MSPPTAAAPRPFAPPAVWRLPLAAARLRDALRHRLAKPELDVGRLLAESPQAVPRIPHPDDDRLPRLAAASLAVHALLIATALWHEREAPAPSREISVELVQAPAPKAKAEPKQESKPTEPAKRQEAQKAPVHRAAKAARRLPPQKLAAHPQPDPSGPMPAMALPGASADPQADAVAYPQLVLSKLAKAKKEGRYMGVPGYAGVRFRIADDGSLEKVSLVNSSGDPSLDIEAVAMVKRAAPYPAPPPGGRRDYGITLVFEARP